MPLSPIGLESQHMSETGSATKRQPQQSKVQNHVALFADFVENGIGDNLDTFLTRVSTMPALS